MAVTDTMHVTNGLRSLMESISEMKAVDDEDRVSVRSRKASSTGFTGIFILHRLHYLYSFNILKRYCI